MRTRFTFAAAAMAVAVILAACGQGNQYVAPPLPKVTVAKPAKQPITRYLEATGNTAAVNSADLVARVAGFIETINYEDGAPVKKGDLLFTIELEPYKVKLDQAKASESVGRVVLQSGAGRVRALGRTDQAEGHDPGVVRFRRSPPATPRNPRSTTRAPTRASPRSTTNTRRCGRRSTAS